MITVLVSIGIFGTIMFIWWVIYKAVKKMHDDECKETPFQIWFIATLQIILLLLTEIKAILSIIK